MNLMPHEQFRPPTIISDICHIDISKAYEIWYAENVTGQILPPQFLANWHAILDLFIAPELRSFYFPAVGHVGLNPAEDALLTLIQCDWERLQQIPQVPIDPAETPTATPVQVPVPGQVTILDQPKTISARLNAILAATRGHSFRR